MWPIKEKLDIIVSKSDPLEKFIRQHRYGSLININPSDVHYLISYTYYLRATPGHNF